MFPASKGFSAYRFIASAEHASCIMRRRHFGNHGYQVVSFNTRGRCGHLILRRIARRRRDKILTEQLLYRVTRLSLAVPYQPGGRIFASKFDPFAFLVIELLRIPNIMAIQEGCELFYRDTHCFASRLFAPHASIAT